MNWRTDKPTADFIIAKKYGSSQPFNYLLLNKCEDGYEDIHTDKLYDWEEIEKWADLKEDENPTKALFEKCLAEVSPKVRQEVSDRVEEAIRTGKQLQDIEDETVTDCNEFAHEIDFTSKLEEELEAFYCEEMSLNRQRFNQRISGKDKLLPFCVMWDELLKIARHFAKLGMEHREQPTIDDRELEKAAVEAFKHIVDSGKNSFLEIFKAGAKWGAEHTFTHHEVDESLQEAVTHQMEDDQVVDDYVRKGLDEVCLKYAKLGAEWSAEHLKPSLTIKDVEALHTFLYAVKNNKQGVFTFTRLTDEQYQEVIRRFEHLKK